MIAPVIRCLFFRDFVCGYLQLGCVFECVCVCVPVFLPLTGLGSLIVAMVADAVDVDAATDDAAADDAATDDAANVDDDDAATVDDDYGAFFFKVFDPTLFVTFLQMFVFVI